MGYVIDMEYNIIDEDKQVILGAIDQARNHMDEFERNTDVVLKDEADLGLDTLADSLHKIQNQLEENNTLTDENQIKGLKLCVDYHLAYITSNIELLKHVDQSIINIDLTLLVNQRRILEYNSCKLESNLGLFSYVIN